MTQPMLKVLKKITSTDIDYAKKLGYKIKLFGIAKKIGDKILQCVHPVMVSPEMHGATVSGAYNAVIVQSDYAEDSVLVGCGAGRAPTASAVVADIIDIARGLKTAVFGVQTEDMQQAAFADMSERTGRYYIRLRLKDQAGAIAEITSLLAKNNISVESFIQEDQEADDREVIIVTHDTIEATLRDALGNIEKSDYVTMLPVMIRIMV